MCTRRHAHGPRRLSAVIGAFLYLRVIVAMYFAAPQGAAEDSEEVAEFDRERIATLASYEPGVSTSPSTDSTHAYGEISRYT